MFASLLNISIVGNGIPLWLGAGSGALAGGVVAAALLLTVLVIGTLACSEGTRVGLRRLSRVRSGGASRRLGRSSARFGVRTTFRYVAGTLLAKSNTTLTARLAP
jgi:hypothetical protein